MDINKSRDDGSSPLQIACYSNHFYVVEELLKVQSPKVDIDLCDSDGRTADDISPFYMACQNGKDLGAIRAKIGPTSDVDKIFSKMYSQYVLFRNKYS